MLQPLVNALFQLLTFFYKIFGGNLGLSIISITILIKFLVLPLMIPSMKSAKVMQNLKPDLDKLKNKHTDKKELQAAQMALYKENGVNPMAGCLPQIIQILILISLYNVFINFLKQPSISGLIMNPNFLYLDLTKPDKTYIFPILAGLSQFIFSYDAIRC
jgi:YidC/Oxa1 family membrane protein insertase